jgi:hypothetical protein
MRPVINHIKSIEKSLQKKGRPEEGEQGLQIIYPTGHGNAGKVEPGCLPVF